jgi:hypothetical protein
MHRTPTRQVAVSLLFLQSFPWFHVSTFRVRRRTQTLNLLGIRATRQPGMSSACSVCDGSGAQVHSRPDRLDHTPELDVEGPAWTTSLVTGPHTHPVARARLSRPCPWRLHRPQWRLTRADTRACCPPGFPHACCTPCCAREHSRVSPRRALTCRGRGRRSLRRGGRGGAAGVRGVVRGRVGAEAAAGHRALRPLPRPQARLHAHPPPQVGPVPQRATS